MRFALEQFGHVLALRDARGKPYVLIGGQAVYFWASRYAAEERGVEQWRPFTSKDIDFHNGRDDVLRIAKELGLKTQLPHSREMTALAGIVPFQIGNSSTTVEVYGSLLRCGQVCWRNRPQNTSLRNTVCGSPIPFHCFHASCSLR